MYIEIPEQNAYKYFGYNSTASDKLPLLRKYNTEEEVDEYCKKNYPVDYDGLRNVSIIICFFNEHWITLWEQLQIILYCIHTVKLSITKTSVR